MFLELEVLSLILCASFLTLGAWSDLKTREVSNRLWIVSLPIATVITAIKVDISQGLLTSYAISMALNLQPVVLITVSEDDEYPRWGKLHKRAP